MLLNRGLRITRHIRDLVQTVVRVIAALPLRASTITQALNIERVRELQQPVLALRQRAKVRRRRTLKPLSSLKSRYYSPPSPGVEGLGKKSALTAGMALFA